MKKINNFFYIFFLFFILLTFSANAENKILNVGNSDSKITIKVFSSLTCPHCASFHKNIFENPEPLISTFLSCQNNDPLLF